MSECLLAFLDELKAEAERRSGPSDPPWPELRAAYHRAIFTHADPHGPRELARIARAAANSILRDAGIDLGPELWSPPRVAKALERCGHLARDILPGTQAADRRETLMRAMAVLHALRRLVEIVRLPVLDEKREVDLAVLAHAILAAAAVPLSERLVAVRRAFPNLG